MLKPLFVLLSFLLVLPAFPQEQELPKKIRGYAVHRESISVRTSDADTIGARTDVVVKVGDPIVTDVGLGGISFELTADVTSAQQTGKVDFLTFHNVRIDGVSVTIEEYRHPFSFRRNERVSLPAPARIFLPTTGLLHGAWRELRDSKKEWKVTGRVFVFGRFRRYGFNHRRVVPIDIILVIKNPLLSPSGRISLAIDFLPFTLK